MWKKNIKKQTDLQTSKKAVIIIVLKIMEKFALRTPYLDVFFTLDVVLFYWDFFLNDKYFLNSKKSIENFYSFLNS